MTPQGATGPCTLSGGFCTGTSDACEPLTALVGATCPLGVTPQCVNGDCVGNTCINGAPGSPCQPTAVANLCVHNSAETTCSDVAGAPSTQLCAQQVCTVRTSSCTDGTVHVRTRVRGALAPAHTQGPSQGQTFACVVAPHNSQIEQDNCNAAQYCDGVLSPCQAKGAFGASCTLDHHCLGKCLPGGTCDYPLSGDPCLGGDCGDSLPCIISGTDIVGRCGQLTPGQTGCSQNAQCATGACVGGRCCVSGLPATADPRVECSASAPFCDATGQCALFATTIAVGSRKRSLFDYTHIMVELHHKSATGPLIETRTTVRCSAQQPLTRIAGQRWLHYVFLWHGAWRNVRALCRRDADGALGSTQRGRRSPDRFFVVIRRRQHW